ncbi:ATP-binding cassette domain-containing protein [Mycobacterium sp. Y57]|uniref:sulfate/molybdate ABC transporter ATP-binding protein n=1 Tax=Mycolicibacterium xanthum TaxID=2796469 RepID=UPI001C85982C|nr:ATP-binding cassette domain-containing protein [Mycolicibacterium xanthum]MBX7435326.1 ATP-binding cassette domain-containing protein [Mycolicibacterium xanthum]
MSFVHIRASQQRRGLDLDLDLGEGDVLAVLGPNGAGKSSLLHLIAGLLRPDRGRIDVAGSVVTDTATGTFVPAHARGVVMLSQQANLFPHMTATANVGYAPRCAGESRAAVRAIARRWLEAVDATELAERRPAQLSGGQAQRIAVARALAAEPRLLLLDEPLAALDVGTAPALRRLLRDLLKGQRRTAIVVTHDLLDALAICDKAVVIERGRVVESGPVRRVLTAPRSDFAARVAGINLLAGVSTGPGMISTAWGEIAGVGDELAHGSAAIALCRPGAVAVHLEHPHGSPRNVLAVTIAAMDLHGSTVRVRGADQPDGAAGLAADITAASAAELDLEPGKTVYFAVKAHEVTLHPALSPPPPPDPG